MTIFRTSGKNIEIYEEYELYTKEYVENVGGKSNFKAKETVIGKKPKTAPPLELNNIYVKVRLQDPNKYEGKFGFDWVDVHPDTKDIEKIQDVLFENVEYFYKEGATPNDLGNIIEKSSDVPGAKIAIQKSYKFNNFCKYVDIPFVLIKPPTTPEKNDGQEITLSAEIILHDGEFKEDEITITGDDYYDFEFIGGTKEDKTAKIKVTKAGKIDFKIKCIKESNIECFYDFKHSNPNQPALPIGGIVMMENKVLKLKFRVIALVSSDNNPNEKAKALFKKFKDAGVKDYLNKNSLNQAGYEVEIENYNEMDNADVDDYFYAFDKEDWGSAAKKYYLPQYNKKYWDIVKNPDGTDVIENGKYKQALTDNPPKPKDVISEDIEIDIKTVEEYKTKLKIKNKSYDGGVIILSDYESPSTTNAFSRANPLNHYLLFMFSNSIDEKDSYAHEMGHMLGLPHFFYTDKEKEAYKNARENIIGNGLPEKNADGTKNNDYREGIIKSIRDVFLSVDIYQGRNYLHAKKLDIISALEKYNKVRQKEVDNEIVARDAKIAYFINYNNNDIVAATQTKREYFKIWNNNIKAIENCIQDNTKAIIDLKNKKTNNYQESKLVKWFHKADLIKLLEQQHNYCKNVLNQVNENFYLFKQDKTKNFMDYYNNDERFFYSYNQILIMRSDIQNYMNIPCEFCNPPSAKKKKK